MPKKMSSAGKKFYITTPIYYVNDIPHVGHAYTTIAADVLARYHRMRGDDVFFLCGTDENAQKNVESARARQGTRNKGQGTRLIVQKYVDEMSAKWRMTWDELDIAYDDFIRTTEPRHVKYVGKFWRMVKKGDIYKGKYEGLYCTGCESYKTESELVNGKCPDHKRAPEKLSEENYFFKLSAYRKKLLDHIKKHPEFIQPVSRRNEIAAYISDHATDFSISRKNLEWGIPVPGDPSQTIYVWFDALLNYLSALFPERSAAKSPPKADSPRAKKGASTSSANNLFDKFWSADLHLVGKDIIKFHCAYWPAMLMSAGLPLPRTVFAHGFFTVDGQKMSKTLGNVVDPVAIAKKYGIDVLRYYLLREISFGGDGDFSEARLRERYNGELANGLGNLVARVLSMIEKYAEGQVPKGGHPERSEGSRANARNADKLRDSSPSAQNDKQWIKYELHLSNFALDHALDTIWAFVSELDGLIDREQPWKLSKKDDKARLDMVLYALAESLRHIAWMLLPFMPETTQKIFDQLGVGKTALTQAYADAQKWGGLKPGTKIKRGESLFPRLS